MYQPKFITLSLLVVGMGLLLMSNRVLAVTSTTPPSFPVSDSQLSDPSTTDFSSDIFSNDFSTNASNSSSSSSSSSSTSDSTADTSSPVAPVSTTSVADTKTGPSQNALFWATFLSILLILQTTRSIIKGNH